MITTKNAKILRGFLGTAIQETFHYRDASSNAMSKRNTNLP